MIYKDFDSLFERFSIMTIDGKLDDSLVLNKLKSQTTEELYKKLKEVIKNNSLKN